MIVVYIVLIANPLPIMNGETDGNGTAPFA
eukprot:COSAG02_NODE_1946_length_10302_cov_13.656768_11_plen_30_part_00